VFRSSSPREDSQEIGWKAGQAPKTVVNLWIAYEYKSCCCESNHVFMSATRVIKRKMYPKFSAGRNVRERFFIKFGMNYLHQEDGLSSPLLSSDHQ